MPDNVKDTLQGILKKAESGKVTIEEIHKAQSIVDSSVILSPIKFRPDFSLLARKRHFHLRPVMTQTLSQSNDDFYTVQEVADRFKVSDKAVYKWISQGKIKFERSSENSRDIRIPKDQFKDPPSKEQVNRRERELFKNAVEMRLARHKDLYREEEKK